MYRIYRSKYHDMNLDLNNAIKQCQSGQVESFGLIYDELVTPIYTFIYHKTWHRETAEDLTSKTFVKALKNIKQFEADKASVKTWLYTIARNTVIDHYRVDKGETVIDEAIEIHNQSDLAVDYDNKQLLEQVSRYLERLEPRQRQIVVMRLWEDLSYQEISEIMGLTADNCKVIFYRSMVKLRSDLAQLASYLLIIISNIIWQ